MRMCMCVHMLNHVTKLQLDMLIDGSIESNIRRRNDEFFMQDKGENQNRS